MYLGTANDDNARGRGYFVRRFACIYFEYLGRCDGDTKFARSIYLRLSTFELLNVRILKFVCRVVIQFTSIVKNSSHFLFEAKLLL